MVLGVGGEGRSWGKGVQDGGRGWEWRWREGKRAVMEVGDGRRKCEATGVGTDGAG